MVVYQRNGFYIQPIYPEFFQIVYDSRTNTEVGCNYPLLERCVRRNSFKYILHYYISGTVKHPPYLVFKNKTLPSIQNLT